MPRNTSHWAYQQQQQQSQEMMYQQQQQQQEDFQHHQPAQQQGRQSYGYQPSQQSSHHSQMQTGTTDCMYDPRDALTDAIATIVLMPQKFERTSMELATKINNSIQDAQSLRVSCK